MILLLCAILSPQRVFLAPLDAYICIIPLILSFLYLKSNKKKHNTLLIIALFISVDTVGDTFSLTPAFIRYPIYILVIFILFDRIKFDKIKLFNSLIILMIPLLVLMFNLDNVDQAALIKDSIILCLAITVLCRNEQSLGYCEIDLKLLIMFLNVYLLSEVVNSIFFYEGYKSGYSNYDSTKALVVLPSLYYIHKNKFFLSLISIALTLFVLINYVTRMIILTYLVISIFYIIMQMVKFDKKTSFLFLLLILSGIVLVYNAENLQQLRIVSMYMRISEGVSIRDMLYIADPVRTIELDFLINQPFLNILFGNGLGVGIHDHQGALHFVGINDGAYPVSEMKSNYYFTFHDIWTDVGLRFGLLPIFIFYLIILRHIMQRKKNTSAIAMLLWVLLFCSYFTTSGLLLISIIALNFRLQIFKNGSLTPTAFTENDDRYLK